MNTVEIRPIETIDIIERRRQTLLGQLSMYERGQAAMNTPDIMAAIALRGSGLIPVQSRAASGIM